MRTASVVLAVGLAMCSSTGRAESPQPTPAMLEEAKALFARLAVRQGMTNATLAIGLAGYFGQEIEGEPSPADQTMMDFYLLRRDPKTGYITYRTLVGSRLRD